MKKANIMKRAWNIYHEAGCTTRYEFGLALKAAWAEAKASEALNNMWVGFKAQSNMTIISYTDFEAAFKAKYPQGSFTKPIMMQNTITIQFVPGGKKYTYTGRYDTVSRKLGLAAA